MVTPIYDSSTIPDTEDVFAKIKRLDPVSARFVFAYADTQEIASAARAAGRTRQWWYKLPDSKRQLLIDLANELSTSIQARAWNVLTNSVEDAARVLSESLKSRDQRVRLQAAIEILDRVLGKSADVQINNNNVSIIFEPHLPAGDTAD
jgi:hypothetical protein